MVSQSSSSPLQVSDGPAHEPQEQAEEQVCVPVEPQEVVQGWVSSGQHPAASQGPQDPQSQLPLQNLICAPSSQHPQVLPSLSPGQHVSSLEQDPHDPHVQLESQVRL